MENELVEKIQKLFSIKVTLDDRREEYVERSEVINLIRETFKAKIVHEVDFDEPPPFV